MRFRLKLTPQNRAFFGLFSRSSTNAVEIARLLVELLDRFPESTELIRRIKDREHEGDRLVRDGVAELFRSGQDAVSIIRWKDIHERLEDAVDACENAADVLEAILVKNR